MSVPLLPAPATGDGAFRLVHAYLAGLAADDSHAFEAMSVDQRIVYSLGELRSGVASAGFEGYFRSPAGDTALDAQAAAALVGHAWQVLLAEACKRLGTPFPVRTGLRTVTLDALLMRDPRALEDLDSVIADLEDDEPVDALLDEYVWATRTAFFS